MSKESGDKDQLGGIVARASDYVEKNPELAEKALDVASKFVPKQTQQGGAQNPYQIQNSPYPPQAEEPQAKKPLRRGISTQSKVMMGVGALMLMLVLGPMIFPAIAGMGAMSSALMAGAGAGLLAYGASKAGEDRDPPSTGYSNRVQPLPNQAYNQNGNPMGMVQQQQPSQSNNQGPRQDSQTNPRTKPEDFNKAIEEARESGAGEGLKENQAIIKEVDAKRAELMDKLALPDNLKTMVNNNSTELPSFEKGLDEHLKKSFFANMEERQSGRGDGGMGKGFLNKVNQEGSEEKRAFDQFKGNMMALLKKDQEHYQSPQARDAIIAEKGALTTAIEQIQGLRAGNESTKTRLDESGILQVERGQKDIADKVRLDSLKTANEKIGKAKENFETKKKDAKSTMGTSQSSQAPAPAKTQAPGQAIS